MSRTYARNEATYDRKLINMMVEDGMATYFPGLPGYVVKTDEATYAVRNHQIIDYPAAAFTILVDGKEFDDNQAEADNAAQELRMDDQQVFLRRANAQGVSVEEYTDGEYTVIEGLVYRRDELVQA